MNKVIANQKVSVIIPVYNAEQTLPACLNSLASQTYPSIELIFIDDCSGDGSAALLNAFAASAILPEVLVFRHDLNRGVAAARNSGLEQASGAYIYYVDADDQIAANAVELMVNTLVNGDADVVGINWVHGDVKNGRKMIQPFYASPWEAIDHMLHGTMRWNLWLFMAKRSLYEKHQIRFLPGKNMGEDLLVTISLLINAEKIVHLDHTLYYYTHSNDQSMTKVYSDVHIREVSANVFEVEKILKQSRYARQLSFGMALLKLNIKLPLLISDQTAHYEKWLHWFPEANGMIFQNKRLPLRTRFIQWAALNRYYWFIKGYHKVLTKVVYGIIYK